VDHARVVLEYEDQAPCPCVGGGGEPGGPLPGPPPDDVCRDQCGDCLLTSPGTWSRYCTDTNCVEPFETCSPTAPCRPHCTVFAQKDGNWLRTCVDPSCMQVDQQCMPPAPPPRGKVCLPPGASIDYRTGVRRVTGLKKLIRIRTQVRDTSSTLWSAA